MSVIDPARRRPQHNCDDYVFRSVHGAHCGWCGEPVDEPPAAPPRPRPRRDDDDVA